MALSLHIIGKTKKIGFCRESVSLNIYDLSTLVAEHQLGSCHNQMIKKWVEIMDISRLSSLGTSLFPKVKHKDSIGSSRLFSAL